MEIEGKRVENEYKEKRAKYLQKITGQAIVATPDEYEDVDLYVKMTQHYYVCKSTFLIGIIISISIEYG